MRTANSWRAASRFFRELQAAVVVMFEARRLCRIIACRCTTAFPIFLTVEPAGNSSAQKTLGTKAPFAPAPGLRLIPGEFVAARVGRASIGTVISSASARAPLPPPRPSSPPRTQACAG